MFQPAQQPDLVDELTHALLGLLLHALHRDERAVLQEALVDLAEATAPERALRLG